MYAALVAAIAAADAAMVYRARQIGRPEKDGARGGLAGANSVFGPAGVNPEKDGARGGLAGANSVFGPAGVNPEKDPEKDGRAQTPSSDQQVFV